MTEVVVEIGPAVVRGVNDVASECVSAALECIDDDLALVGERAVSVAGLWADVLRAAAGADVDTLVAVCPTWWPAPRVERVRAAAAEIATTVVMCERTPLLRSASGYATTVVEIADEVVVVTPVAAGAVILPNVGDAVARDVAAFAGSRAVLIDVPPGLPGADALGTAIADRLRADGAAVTFAEDVRLATPARHADSVDDTDPPKKRGRAAVVVGVLATVAVCGGFAVSGRVTTPSPQVLVEGRMSVTVPSGWSVQRVTSGPGSARLQVVSPTDREVALQLTQSAVPRADLAATGEAIRNALAGQNAAVFVDFNAADHRADRPAVTYREVRQDHHVAWTVVVDRGLRIAIGCQSRPGGEQLVREACDRAIRSAHATSEIDGTGRASGASYQS